MVLAKIYADTERDTYRKRMKEQQGAKGVFLRQARVRGGKRRYKKRVKNYVQERKEKKKKKKEKTQEPV